VVTTDVSDVGIGAVLEQEGRPVTFVSRKLSAAERNYTTTERELLAVVHALRTWRCYVEGGQRFMVKTDHNPNTYFATKAMLSRREARWSEYLQWFDFARQYKPGVENAVADALSRAPMGIPVVRSRPRALAITTRSATRPKSSAGSAGQEATAALAGGPSEPSHQLKRSCAQWGKARAVVPEYTLAQDRRSICQ
jgi:hypothetical protein